MTLKENHYLPIPFTVPQSKMVLIDMESERGVDLYVFLNESELLAFQQGQRPYRRAAFNIRQFYNKINLSSLGAPVVPLTSGATALLEETPSNPRALAGLAGLGLFFPPSVPLPGSTWYLVIQNRPGNQPIAIYYRVYNT